MSSALALLRSRTSSPAMKKSAETNDSSSQNNHRASESVSPERRALSPRTTDMNRVHEELEKLNIATDVINKLELQLDQARETFREIQNSWTQKLEQLSKKLGACIDKSRPYYEARMKLLEAQQEAQRAALRFERANSLHAVAKQQVALTQESLNRQQPGEVDPACLEVLNHHVQRVNEAELERLQSEEGHRRVSGRVEEANRRVSGLEKELKRSIQKSKQYFEARVEFTKVLEDQKALIQRLEVEIKQKKQDYNTSLRNLERISEEIHERRQSLGRRGPGVGSETPDPPPTRKESGNLEANLASSDTRERLPSAVNDTQTKTPVVYLRRKSKSSKVDDLMEILGAKTVVMATDDNGERRRADSIPTGTQRARLNSGIILLAQQLLSSAGNGETERAMTMADRKTRAFTFPPEQLDLQYKTIPEGVKPFPTPPETPASPPRVNPMIGLVRRGSDTNLLSKQPLTAMADGIHSDASSVCSFALDDDHVERVVMKSPFNIMKEIDNVFDRIQNSAEQSEEDSACSVRPNFPAEEQPECGHISGVKNS